MRCGPHKPVLSLTSPSGSFYIALVKWRNQLLALFCLCLFAGFGVLYFRYWVVQKPFGIILFVGEGLSPSRLAALRLYAGGPATSLTLDTLSYTALLKNYSADFATPDSAAAATAIATGVKVNNGLLGVDAHGATLTNLLELARASGRRTGLVTDSRLTNTTAAAFYAHTGAKEDTHELARTLVENAAIDIVLGGGSVDFVSESEAADARTDGRDLLNEADAGGYDVVRTRTELENVAWWRWPKVFGVFGTGDLAYGGEIGPETRQPSLSDMVRRSVELLQIHRGGFLLVVDAALMRKAAEQNDVEGTLAAMLEFDRAISVAMRFAGAKTTVFVCGDVAVGGLSVNGMVPRTNGKPAPLADSASLRGVTVTWATGPNGEQTGPAVSAEAPASDEGAQQAPPPAIPKTAADAPSPDPIELLAEEPRSDGTAEQFAAESSATPMPAPTAAPSPAAPAAATTPPAAAYAPAALNTIEDVIAFGEGRGAEVLHGTLESTALFEIIRDNL